MRNMKKLIKITLVILTIPLFLTSCFKAEQLNERMLVQAVGIDLVEDEIEITLQVYAPATQGGSGISATSDNAKIVKSKGGTITEAIQNAILMQGKTVFMGHNRVIVIGSELAKDGIISTLDYFSSNASSRHNINVIIANEKASDILTTKVNQGIVPAETLEKMITRANEIGVLKNVKLYELLSTLQNDFESATLPIIQLNKEDEDSQESGIKQVNTESSLSEESRESTSKSTQDELDTVSTLKVYGTGIIQNGKLVNELTLEESRGLLFILNEIESSTFTVSTQDYKTAGVKVYESKSKITPTIEHGKIQFHLEITSQAQLGQRELVSNKKATESSIKQLENATALKIEEECKQVFQKAVLESKADIFEFGHIMWQRNPEIWNTTKNNWNNIVNEIEFTVESKVIINRVGLEL